MMRLQNMGLAGKLGRSFILGTALIGCLGSSALAQQGPGYDRDGGYGNGNAGFDPQYNHVNRWSPMWDQGNYDRHHVLIGTVDSFSPYRLTISQQNGVTRTVDLKNGTIIRPTGMTPTQGQRVAVMGYWSKGTFIANRVVLHG
jgi:hypothetical protein